MFDVSEIDFTPIPRRIKHIRESKGRTQEEVAADCGISRNFYTGIENGRNICGYDKLTAIAVALDVSLDELVQDVVPAKSASYQHFLSDKIAEFDDGQKAMLNDQVDLIKEYKIKK